ncbi:MAG: 6-bladed beta-propeller [Bacteroidales bacterium]|nr:6-bladed beta-propeller [Bacteroidales bacterium]
MIFGEKNRNFKVIIRLILICALFIMGVMQIYSQENKPIKYIGKIDSELPQNQKNFFKIIGNLLFGKEDVIISNPVDVYAENINDIWILCQGNGSLARYNAGKLRIAKAFRKKGNTMPSMVSLCNIEGKILFTDSYDERIYQLSKNGKTLSPFAKDLDFKRPTGIAYSKVSNQIWVLETSAHRIRILDKNGNHIKFLGSRGTGNREFNFPTHIWIDKNGRVYIVDSMNFRVQIYNHNGNFISCFGNAGNASGDMARPKGIATDSFGNIYVADALFHAVQIFDEKGNFLYSFGAQGRGQGQFWLPNGIYVDDNDYIYVSDNYNNRIQIFKLTGYNE